MGGVGGVDTAKVVFIGAGVSGQNARPTSRWAWGLTCRCWELASGAAGRRSLALGLNTHAGQLTNALVGKATGIDAIGPEEALGGAWQCPIRRRRTRNTQRVGEEVAGAW